jgi:SAM-dependent methyltransferase
MAQGNAKPQAGAYSFESAANPSQIASAEFPHHLLHLLRCTRDAGNLILAAELQSGPIGVVQGLLKCTSCNAEYSIEDGIARLMHGDLTREDQQEMAMRDSQNAQLPIGSFIPPPSGWRSLLSDLLEIPPHLDALRPAGRRVLEIGCGDGRLTILLAQMGATVLAVDFSFNSLRVLGSRLRSGIAPTTYQLPGSHSRKDLRHLVGLVQADASHFSIAPRSFDRALSSTPLDSREQRMALYHTIAEALTDEGRYVGGVEHDDLTRRLLGLPTARRYSSGIFIEHFSSERLRCEIAPYFSGIHIRPIRPRLPFIHRLPYKCALYLSRIATVLPVLRHLSEILLLRAEKPVRPTLEGVHRPGNKFFKRLYRWYMHKIDKPPLWEDNEPV